jgi:copper homeostasis protein
MNKKVVKEFCAENFNEVKDAISRGANRIELNDNMTGWGTTPSIGNIKQTLKYCNEHGVPVIVMNRPRGGEFHYTEDEKEIIRTDLEEIIKLGPTGVAFGALDENNILDIEFLEEFIQRTKESNLEMTFHRAFDSIPYESQIESLRWLANQGVDRIATHGGPDSSNILDNVERLKELNEVDQYLEVMAGGGVTKDNYEQLVELANITEVHGTQIV